MNIRFEKWKNWDAVKCTAGQNELIVGISAGPRILSFSHNGGENQLYEDTTNFGVGEWRMFGGHRFTVAPENENSCYSDNKPCDCRVEGAMLHVSAKQRSDGLILSLLIRASQPGGFWIDHVLLNNGSNVELFVCAGWTEMETLSEKYIVVPGSSVSHRQHWQFQPICKI